MKKTTMITLMATATIVASAIAASAGTTPGVGQRQKAQMKRIHQGVHSGALTPRETGKLLHEEAKIQRMKRRIKVDGVVTPRERARLHHALNKQHVRIRRKKHN